MLWVYCLVICSTVQYSTYFASMIEGKFLHSGLIAVRDSAQINPAPSFSQHSHGHNSSFTKHCPGHSRESRKMEICKVAIVCSFVWT